VPRSDNATLPFNYRLIAESFAQKLNDCFIMPKIIALFFL